MTLISHANTMPWLVQPGFFMTLTMLLLNGLVAISVVTLLYRILHRLLSHQEAGHTSLQHTGGIGGTSGQPPLRDDAFSPSQAGVHDHES
ncbi:MAG: hypothetical protein ABW076_01815 [Candidatus Thiodiazotropha sp.]